MNNILLKINESLTNEQKKLISEMFEKLMAKYEKKSNLREFFTGEYFPGVVDGINHCFKAINGIEDDYLDGIE